MYLWVLKELCYIALLVSREGKNHLCEHWGKVVLPLQVFYLHLGNHVTEALGELCLAITSCALTTDVINLKNFWLVFWAVQISLIGDDSADFTSHYGGPMVHLFQSVALSPFSFPFPFCSSILINFTFTFIFSFSFSCPFPFPFLSMRSFHDLTFLIRFLLFTSIIFASIRKCRPNPLNKYTTLRMCFWFCVSEIWLLRAWKK